MPRRFEALALSVLMCAVSAALPFALRARAETQADSEPRQTAVQAMFFNVGKADASLYCLGDKYYLVDTGTKESADAMLRALAYYQVTNLDGVVITHTDKDHVGGLKTLLKSDITVAQLYAPAYSVYAVEDHPVTKLSEKYNVALTWLYAGDSISVQEDMAFTALGPISLDQQEENNNSLVLRLVTPQGDMLLSADMEVQEESELLAAGVIQAAEVLKVGHHGADDASSERFIYTVRPELAVISTDPAEDDDTPNPKVMMRLWNVGADVYITNQASCCVEVTLSGGTAVGRLVNYLVE